MPESSLPADIRDIYQDMWANNGDAISRQYAGTAAMKVNFRVESDEIVLRINNPCSFTIVYVPG